MTSIWMTTVAKHFLRVCWSPGFNSLNTGQEGHYKYFIKEKKISKVIQIKITNIETSIFKIENVLYLSITVIVSMTLL